MATNDTVLARILIDDQTKLGFNSYARNVERAKKTSEAFRKHAIDKISLGLEKQVQVLKKTAKEFDLLQAANMGANEAQLEHITSLHDAIDAHHAAEKAAEEQRKAQEALAAAQKRSDDITEKAIQNLQFQAQAADMDADEIEILRLRLMGLSEEQLDLVRDTQLATKAKREQGKAAGRAHGQFRLMRGGLGQLGHQVQDVAVQLQMGQNALLVLGQQGGQVASLFGQNGALIGAFLAVGAALGTALAPELFETKDHLEELKKVAEETARLLSIDFVSGIALLTNELDEMAQKSENLARAKLQERLVNALIAVEESTAAVRKEFSEVMPSSLGTDVNAAVDEFTLLASELKVDRDQLELLNQMFVDFTRGTGVTIDEVAELSQKLSDQATTAGRDGLAFVEMNARLQEFAVGQKEASEIITVLQDALDGRITKTEAGAEADEKAAEASKAHFENVQGIIRGIREQIIAIDEGAEAALRYRLANQGLTESEIDLIAALENVRKQAAEEKRLSEESAESDRKKAEEKNNFIKSINEQAAALGKTSIELLREKAAIHGVTTELEEAFETLEKFKRDQEAASDRQRIESNVEAVRQSLLTEEEALLESHQKKLADLEEAKIAELLLEETYNEQRLKLIADFERRQAEIRKKSGKEEILQGSELTGHMLDQLGKQFSGVQAANKKMFAAQKAFKIASAIQNTYTAANEALASPYPHPIPHILAATAIAAGLANVAAIKSSSFEGGGFTGFGSRSGGMDGKGGFPAILHPNETVIDHTKGQGQGITIINNVDASGAGADVDMKIASAMQQTSQQTIATVQDLMRRRRM